MLQGRSYVLFRLALREPLAPSFGGVLYPSTQNGTLAYFHRGHSGLGAFRENIGEDFGKSDSGEALNLLEINRGVSCFSVDFFERIDDDGKNEFLGASNFRRRFSMISLASCGAC